MFPVCVQLSFPNTETYFLSKPYPRAFRAPYLRYTWVRIRLKYKIYFLKFLTYSGLEVLTLCREPCQYQHCTSFPSQVICTKKNMFPARAQLSFPNTKKISKLPHVLLRLAKLCRHSGLGFLVLGKEC